MAAPFWNQIARLPRHSAEERAYVVVEVERLSAVCPAVISGRLSDLSRHGARLRMEQPLVRGEQIVLRIWDTKHALDLRFPATVRWQHADGESMYLVGCQLDGQVEWETYGELFLNGILESE